MKFKYSLTTVLLVLLAYAATAQHTIPERYALAIKVDGLYNHIETLTGRDMQGRKMGTKGGEEARDYLAWQLQALGVEKPFDQGYCQHFEHDGLKGANVIGILEGTDLRHETVLLMAHYDYIGVSRGIVYPGADDNASGVAALLEIAATLQQAKKDGFVTRRTIVFAFFDGNKRDLAGAAYYMNNPLFKPENTVLAINLDMVGRTDGYAEGFDDYVFVLGADRLSSDLKSEVNRLNDEYIQLTVDHDFYNNDLLFKLFYPMSDHIVFEKRSIPVLLFTAGVTGNIHDVGDTIDKISFPTLMRRARLAYHVAWWYASQGLWPQMSSKAQKN